MSIIPPIISRDPIGLLGFLDTKTGGQRPQQLAEFVQPTLEMFDWYFEGQARIGFGTTPALVLNWNIAAGGSPPPGKGWWVRRILGQQVSSVANNAAWGVAICTNVTTGGGLILQQATDARGAIIGATTNDAVAIWEGLVFLRDEGAISAYAFSPLTGVPLGVALTWQYAEVDL